RDRRRGPSCARTGARGRPLLRRRRDLLRPPGRRSRRDADRARGTPGPPQRVGHRPFPGRFPPQPGHVRRAAQPPGRPQAPHRGSRPARRPTVRAMRASRTADRARRTTGARPSGRAPRRHRARGPDSRRRRGRSRLMGILTDDMKRVVREQRLGFVATVCQDGTPNLSPKGTTVVYDDDHLLFMDIRSPGTVANLRQNPAVEINVVDPFVRKGYRFKGKGEVIEKDARFEELLGVYESDEWGMLSEAGRRAGAVVLVRVEHAAPLVSPGYDWVESEQQMRAHWVEHFEELEASRT